VAALCVTTTTTLPLCTRQSAMRSSEACYRSVGRCVARVSCALVLLQVRLHHSDPVSSMGELHLAAVGAGAGELAPDCHRRGRMGTSPGRPSGGEAKVGDGSWPICQREGKGGW
jgi:hypothetical protein